MSDLAEDVMSGGLVVGLDGDDTLWHNETIFQDTQSWYHQLLTESGVDEDAIHGRLLATERRNLRHFGYGIKGFTLSLIETGIELTGGSLPNDAITAIIDRGRAMIDHPTHVIDGVVDALTVLGSRCRLLLITKGDLLDQEGKVARSGLADYFADVHIVTEKDQATYQRILDRHEIDPENFIMVGNSVPSDIQPVIDIGGSAIHVPYHVTWEIETVAASSEAADFQTLDTIHGLPAAIDRMATR